MALAAKGEQHERDANYQALKEELELWRITAQSAGSEVYHLSDALCKVSDVLDASAKIAAHRFGSKAREDPAVVLPIMSEVMALFRMRLDNRTRVELAREVADRSD